MADIQETPERKPIICAHITNPKDMADMFKDLSRLRDSNYARRWHDFPTTKEEIQDTLNIIRIDSEKHGEYYINDYESSIPGLAERLQAGANIDELNYLAVKLAEMDDFELEKFSAAMEYSVFRDGLADIINTAENLDCFDLQPAFSAAEYGKFLADMDYDKFALQIKALEESGNPADRELAAYIGLLEKHFNTEAYGYEQVKEEGGCFTKHGYLTKETALEESYIGLNNIPPEYRVSAPPELLQAERASVMDRLAAAKDAAAQNNAGKPAPDKPAKSHDAEL